MKTATEEFNVIRTLSLIDLFWLTQPTVLDTALGDLPLILRHFG